MTASPETSWADPGTPGLVVIGGSAGGIDGLRPLLTSLPRDFAAPVCIVIHVTLPVLFQRIRSVAGVASRYARSGL